MSQNHSPNSTQGAAASGGGGGATISASIKNKQKTFNQNLPRLEPEHPLFKSASTAKIFPALATVPEKEVAQMFGLPEINKRRQKENYLIEHSNPYVEKPSMFSRDGMRGAGDPNYSPSSSHHHQNQNNNTAAGNNTNSSSLAAQYYSNDQSHRSASHEEMMRSRLKRPFVVTRHGVSTGAPIHSVFAGCDFEGDERNQKKIQRESLYKSMKRNNRNNAFVVRNASDASRELARHEYLNSVDDDTMELLKDYIFSGRAALDAAARKRKAIDDFRTNQRRSKGIRNQTQQQKLKMIRDRNHQNGSNNNNSTQQHYDDEL